MPVRQTTRLTSSAEGGWTGAEELLAPAGADACAVGTDTVQCELYVPHVTAGEYSTVRTRTTGYLGTSVPR